MGGKGEADVWCLRYGLWLAIAFDLTDWVSYCGSHGVSYDDADGGRWRV